MPQGTPAAVIRRVNRDLDAALKETAIARRLIELGILSEGAGTPAQLGEFLTAEHVRWAKLAKEVGVVAD